MFLRGDDDIHQLIATSTLIEGIGRDGSGCVDDHIRTAAAGGAAAGSSGGTMCRRSVLSHYRQKQTETIK